MKTLTRISFLAFTILLFTACGSSLTVTSDYDRSVDFSQFRTFGIYRLPADAQTISPLSVERVYASIRAAMTAKGFTESANPDVWVNSLMVLDTREQHSSTTTGMGMGMGMGMGGMGWGMGGMHRPYMWGNPMMMGGPMMMSTTSHTRHHVDVYQVGSLMIDIIDAKNNTLIWHANGDRKISDNMRRNPEENMLKYVTRILDSFPPGGLVHNVTVVKD